MKENTEINSIIESLLGEMSNQTKVTYTLPSRGLLTGGKDSINLSPITWRSEKSIAQKLKAGDKDLFRLITEMCSPELPVEFISAIDLLFILVKVRELTYGPEYTLDINCPKCNSENKVTIDISQLGVNYLSPEDLIDEDCFALVLPKSKLNVKYKIPKVSELHYLQNDEEANLWRFVKKVEDYDNQEIISKLIPKLHIMDIHALLKAIGGENYGLNKDVYLECSHCKKMSVVALPLTQGFFTMNSN